MNTVPREINIEDWEQFGGGFTSDTFYHKTDDAVMLKLFASFMKPEDSLKELLISEAVSKLGIPTAGAIEYVKAAGRYGAIYERLKGKRSIARVLADEPERLEEMAKIFAEEGKKLHSVKCNKELFKDIKDVLREKIASTGLVSEEKKQRALDLIEGAKSCDTCLHGDFQIGNMLIVDNHPMFIDLADFAYGDPIFDISFMAFQAIAGSPKTCERLYHISQDCFVEFWKRFKFYYYDSDADLAAASDESFLPFVGLAALRYCINIGEAEPYLMNVVDRYL